MELKRKHIVDGIEVATPEYFNALSAVNFIIEYKIEWTINSKEKVDYDLQQMLEHVKVIAGERGRQLEVNEHYKFIVLSLRKIA